MNYKIFSSAIIYELLNDEIILANLDNGNYYSLRNSAVPIWQSLTQGQSLKELCSLFEERYGKPLQQSIESFVQTLVKEKLLIETESSSLRSSEEPLYWPERIEIPILEKYEEMKSLLMLDPIHEVDAQGWPNRS